MCYLYHLTLFIFVYNILMASLALRAFSSIASRAPQVFRTIWSTIKSSPTLNSIKDVVIG